MFEDSILEVLSQRTGFTSTGGTSSGGLRQLVLKKPYELFPHQITAVMFMKMRERESRHGIRGGHLCLLMGLGKTLISVAHSLTSKKGETPTLIVCSKSLMMEWKEEGFEKFFEGVKVLYVHSDFIKKDELAKLTPATYLNYDFVVTTYDVLKSAFVSDAALSEDISVYKTQKYSVDKKRSLFTIRKRNENDIAKASASASGASRGIASLFYVKWERCIADESHTYVNSDTYVFKAMMSIVAKYMWGMSGTWIRNEVDDIFSQLRVIGYESQDVQTVSDWSKRGMSEYYREKLGECILHMDYEEAGIKMPRLVEKIVSVKMGPRHATLYSQAHSFISKNTATGAFTYANMFGMLMRLRQISVAPSLIFSEEKDCSKIPGFEIDERLLNDHDLEATVNCAKMLELVKLIKSFNGDKFIIFTSYCSVQKLVQQTINYHLPQTSIHCIDGSTPMNERKAIINDVKTNDDIQGVCMTFKVGSEGINLQTANNVIIIDPWWSPCVHQQAIQRSWRMGQTRDVSVYYLISKNTIEEKILEVCNEKKVVAGTIAETSMTAELIKKILF